MFCGGVSDRPEYNTLECHWIMGPYIFSLRRSWIVCLPVAGASDSAQDWFCFSCEWNSTHAITESPPIFRQIANWYSNLITGMFGLFYYRHLSHSHGNFSCSTIGGPYISVAFFAHSLSSVREMVTTQPHSSISLMMISCRPLLFSIGYSRVHQLSTHPASGPKSQSSQTQSPIESPSRSLHFDVFVILLVCLLILRPFAPIYALCFVFISLLLSETFIFNFFIFIILAIVTLLFFSNILCPPGLEQVAKRIISPLRCD